jgi:hypothetical protein
MNPLDRYTARVHRQYSARYGAERADREAPTRARYNLALFAWIVPIFLAALANTTGAPRVALLLYVLAILLAAVLFVAWRRMRAARRD